MALDINGTTQEEQEQLERLETFRKLSQSIISRHWFFLIVSGMIGASAMMGYLYNKVIKSPIRYTTSTRLQYYPMRSKKVDPYDNNHVLQLLTRSYILKKLGEELNLSEDERATLAERIVLDQSSDKNIYEISVKAATRDGAVLLANGMADLCRREYLTYRKDDLQKWTDTLMQRKNEKMEAIKLTEVEEEKLRNDEGVDASEGELFRLRGIQQSQRMNLGTINGQLAQLQAAKRNLEAGLKAFNPNLLVQYEKIKEYTENLKNLDKEILKLRQIYTPDNPKLLELITLRKQIEEEFNNFKKERQIEGTLDQTVITSVHEGTEKLKEVVFKIEGLLENQQAVQEELKEIEARISKMTKLIPRFAQIRQERDVQMQTLRDVEDSISEANYMISNVNNDLLQVELATGANEESPFQKANLVVAMMSGAVLMGLMGLLVLFVGIVFGKVRNYVELCYYTEITTLGAIPPKMSMFKSETDAKMVLDSMFYKFQTVQAPKQVIFHGEMAGSKPMEEVIESFEWNLAMAGARLLQLKIVSAQNFEESQGDDVQQLSAVTCVGNQAWMPVENPFALTPSELPLLKADIEELQKNYDVIMISSENKLSRRGVFFSQMLDVCDSVLLAVGAKRTSRADIRYVIDRKRKTKRCVMAIMTNASEDMIRMTKGE